MLGNLKLVEILSKSTKAAKITLLYRINCSVLKGFPVLEKIPYLPVPMYYSLFEIEYLLWVYSSYCFCCCCCFCNVIYNVLEWDPERHLDLENKPTGNSKAILHSQCRYTWMLHLAAFENSSKIFLRCIFITLYLLLLTTFINKALDYQFDYILSLELEQKFGLRCP